MLNDSDDAEDEREAETWVPAALPPREEPRSAEVPVREPVSEAETLRKAVVDAVGRSSPLLKTGLSSSLPWRVDGERLVVPFRSGMEESVVRGAVPAMAAAAAQAAGRAIKVELRVERPEAHPKGGHGAPHGEGPDPAAIVERVFRGSRVAPERKGP